MNYSVLMVDPPWPYEMGGTKKSRPTKYDKEWAYSTMSIAQIGGLLASEILPLMHSPHVLFMWALERSLLDAEAIGKSLGYKRHCRLIWDKRTGHAPAFTVQFAHEYLIWFYKSPMMKIDPAQRGKIRTVFQATPRQHSRKPDIAYAIVEALYPGLKRLDVFSRENRPGWDSWGDEKGKFT